MTRQYLLCFLLGPQAFHYFILTTTGYITWVVITPRMMSLTSCHLTLVNSFYQKRDNCLLHLYCALLRHIGISLYVTSVVPKRIIFFLLFPNFSTTKDFLVIFNLHAQNKTVLKGHFSFNITIILTTFTPSAMFIFF